MKIAKKAFVLLFVLTFSAQAFAAEKLVFPRRNAVVKVVEKVRESVVNISTERIALVSSPWDDMFGFDKYYRKYKTNSLGSGVIVDEDGYIVTNAHVVKRATRIKVKLSDKTEHEADLISVQTENDLALLKITTDGKLKPISLGTSSDLMIGETAIALGNPFGLSSTVTVGVISATDRSITVGGKVVFKDFLQTDAAINPGNSGGPLVNINGRLVGINTAIHSGATGIGFAIPVDRVRAVLRKLISPGAIAEVFIGFTFDDKNDDRLVVQTVVSSSPAEKAGIRAGDVLTAVEGDEVDNFLDLAKHIIDKKPGDKVRVRLLRGASVQNVTVELAATPETPGERAARKKTGITLRRLPAFKAHNMGLDFKTYLMVESVEKGGPGGRIGITKGDIIRELAIVGENFGRKIIYAREQVHDYPDLERFFSRIDVPTSVTITIQRGGSEFQGRLVTR